MLPKGRRGEHLSKICLTEIEPQQLHNLVLRIGQCSIQCASASVQAPLCRRRSIADICFNKSRAFLEHHIRVGKQHEPLAVRPVQAGSSVRDWGILQGFGCVPIAACKHHAIKILHIVILNLSKSSDVAPEAVVVLLAGKSGILRAQVLERCLDAVWVKGGAHDLAWTGTRRIMVDEVKTACCALMLPVYGSTYVTPGSALSSALSEAGPP